MISKKVKNIISEFKDGKVFKLDDLGLPRDAQNAVVVALGRLVQRGEIERLSPGIYYKPNRTRFGPVGPAMEERVKDLLYENGVPVGYLTGFYAFNLLGLTTQISTILEIGSNFPKRNRKRGLYVIRFVLQKNPITVDNIEFLRLLDCIKWIKVIPDTTVDRSYVVLKKLVNAYTVSEQKRLVELSLNYSPLTRALLGSMLKDSVLANVLYETVNPLTLFKIGLSSNLALEKWNLR